MIYQIYIRFYLKNRIIFLCLTIAVVLFNQTNAQSQVDSMAIYGDALNIATKEQDDKKIIYHAENIKRYLKRNGFVPYPDFFLNLNFLLITSYTNAKNFKAISEIFPELFSREDCLTNEHIVLYNILLQQVSDAFIKINEPSMADSVANLGIKYLKSFKLEDNYDMAAWYPVKAQIAENQFKYSLAETYLLEYCQRIEPLELPIKVYKSTAYRSLAGYYIRMNKFSKAEDAINKGLKHIITPEDSLSNYHTTLLLLSMDCFNRRNELNTVISTAIKIETILDNISEFDISNNLMLLDLAVQYLEIKDTKKAKSIYDKAISNLIDNIGLEDQIVLNAQSFYAFSLSEHMPLEAIKIYETIISISEKREYLEILKDSYIRLCIIYYRFIKDYEKALVYSDLYFKLVHPETSIFSSKIDIERHVSALANGSFLLSNSKKYEQSIDYDLQIIRLCDKYYNENNDRKKTALQSISNSYSNLNKVTQALDYLNKWHAAINQKIDENFYSFLFSADKEEKYIHDYEMFTEKIRRYNNQGIEVLGLNLHLKMKGIQQSFFANLLRSSWSNPSLKRYVNEYLSIPADEIQLDKIQRKIELENIIFKNNVNSKKIADYLSLKKSLKSNEAIIEFGNYNYVYNVEKDQFSKKYFCYIIKKNDSIPIFVDLGFQLQFDSLLKSNSNKIESFYTYNFSSGFNNLFLNPILPHLNGIEHLIISPIGSLYNLNFSLLPLDSTTFLGNKFDVRLISNSYSVISNNEPLNPVVVYLYGGLDYDAKPDKNSIVSYITNSSATKATPESIVNYQWNYLRGSLEEINSVASIIQKKSPNLKVHKLTGSLGSETAFRSLDYSKPFVLHLATHGFSVPTVYDYNSSNSLRSTIIKSPERERPKTKTVLNSGFVLSGANFSNQSSSNNENDGIVLAEDINFLNFTNCDLLVLSACKTGVGTIKNNEGVFGLGRAFKISGVRNIIVSQWEVPDKETSELFRFFYNEVYSGKSYRQALFNAQMGMKARYDDPYLWAAFLLIE